MKNLNFKFLYEQLQNDAMGYSRIFHEYYEGRIIILNLERKYGYVWDDKTKLYKPEIHLKSIALLALEKINNHLDGRK